jgi:hypothetical protein
MERIKSRAPFTETPIMDSDYVEERALHQYIRRRTVRLVDLTDGSQGGTAVTIKLRERYFLATAAHVIPEDHRILIVANDVSKQDTIEFKARHVDDDDDLGLLELGESEARLINRDFTDASTLLASVQQTAAWRATLVGYPGQLINSTEETGSLVPRRVHNFPTLVLSTEIIPLSEWPDAGPFNRHSPLSESDLFVRCDSNTQVFEQNLKRLSSTETLTPIDELKLNGMSGCGIWFDKSAHGQIWRPEPLLAGIQTGANLKRGWARGTQIRRWLQLAAKHYPELESINDQITDANVGQ